MKENLIERANDSYRIAEKKSQIYYQSLNLSINKKAYIDLLKRDINFWSKNHIKKKSLMSIILNKKLKNKSKDYKTYIEYLDYSGKLDDYLDRSVSYIFMRDLGKSLESEVTKADIKKTVGNLKKHLNSSKKKKNNQEFTFEKLYKKAKEEGIEQRMIWLIEKLKKVSKNIPDGINNKEAIRKIIKIIIGVVMHQLDQLDSDIGFDERRKKLDESIVLGYSYGLTYPFIDDLLDAKILSAKEEKIYSDIIRETLITGEVPTLKLNSGKNIDLIKYIHQELREAFKYIKAYQSEEKLQSFLNLSYIFFNAQEVDRNKSLENMEYKNEEIYVPVILKSAASRLIIRSVINAKEDNDFENRTFFYGIYNQLADDFTDMFDDFKREAVTPYTYYIKYHDKRDDIINPFEAYWATIAYLINDVYGNDNKACEIILDRAINGLKRLRERVGEDKYKEIMDFFAFDDEFDKLIRAMVKDAEDVDFFDKLVRDYVIDIFEQEKKEKQIFLDTIKTAKNKINEILFIKEDNILEDNEIINASNYSIDSGGKRLRPIIAWYLGVKVYKLDEKSIEPLLKSLEYMHTASLILDDLPSQDNASVRRGRKTVHEEFNIATAELSSLFLTQDAIGQQSLLNDFNPKVVLKLIKYSTETVKKMCSGQSMDLKARGKVLSVEELKKMCFYKTGIAFEAALVMIAILADINEEEIKLLKDFAKHAGIAFQIKDDILDVEGSDEILGKKIGIDKENNSSTFVSVLGYQESQKELWENYIIAMDILKKIPRETKFLEKLMDYIITRDS